jgi:2-dehydropantoate 2-reductase
MPYRYIIYGAGAIGGVVGARLARQSRDVTLIARGSHLRALRENGLRLEAPDGPVSLHPPVHGRPSDARSGAVRSCSWR